MRTVRWAALAVTLIVGSGFLGGCRSSSSDRPRTGPAAQADGVACRMLDYDSVFWLLGVRFDTAGAASAQTTSTCALTQRSRRYPDLTLAVTPTTSDEAIFLATVAPSGSQAVKGLGRIGYQLVGAPAAGRGPSVELGWLSERGQLMLLRYTFAADATPAQPAAFTPRLMTLAQQIEADSV